VRKTTGLLLATATLLTLSACAPGGSVGCESTLPLGGLADTVELSGTADDFPATAAFPTPLVATSSSHAIAVPGDGRVVGDGDAVVGQVTIFDGASGTVVDGGTIMLFTDDEELPFFAGTTCATVNSRVVTVAPAQDFFGDFAANFGIDPAQTVVGVIDIQDAFPGRASGVTVNAIEGLPAVTTAPNGQPGLTFTGAPAPTELTVETLIRGDGEVVKAGDQIVVNYIGVEWETRKVFDDSWSTGRPHAFNLDDVVPGFQQAIIGATAGSRIVMAIPPSEGYGDSAGSPVGPDSTMIFVVDVLGVDRHAH